MYIYFNGTVLKSELSNFSPSLSLSFLRSFSSLQWVMAVPKQSRVLNPYLCRLYSECPDFHQSMDWAAKEGILWGKLWAEEKSQRKHRFSYPWRLGTSGRGRRWAPRVQNMRRHSLPGCASAGRLREGVLPCSVQCVCVFVVTYTQHKFTIKTPLKRTIQGFRAFTMLCSHRHYLVPRHFCHSKRKPLPISIHSPTPLATASGSHNSASCLYGLANSEPFT